MRGTLMGLALLGGCTFGRLDGLTGGGALDASDAGPADASSAPDEAGAVGASDAASDAATGSVLLADSFANADSCNDSSFNSLLSTTTNGRDDGHACKVCGQSPGPGSFSYTIEVPGAVAAAGAHYHATAWYRNPFTGAPPASVSFALRSILHSPFTTVQIAPVSGTSGPDWQRIDADLVLTRPADAIDMFISAPYGAGVCFVFDDLIVTRVP